MWGNRGRGSFYKWLSAARVITFPLTGTFGRQSTAGQLEGRKFAGDIISM